MRLNHEKLIQASITSVIALHILKIVLKGQTIPNKKIVMPVASAMATAYIMGNKSLSIKGDENIQVMAAAVAVAYAYDM